MHSLWRPLQLGAKRFVPPLLIKSDFGLSNYKIWLTDLTYLWSESLDRRQIIQRAFSIDTSIDPSEDTSQLRLLLRCVENALSQNNGTSIDIVQSDNDKQLKLRTSTPLPGNLQPLKWHVQLAAASQFVMTIEVVVPLLSQQLAASVEKISLIQQIRNKDHVIEKLLEKMQSDGLDLSKVFPGAGSSKVGTGPNARRVIGNSVKGLAEFDVGEWQSRIAKDGTFPENLKDLLASVLSADSTKVPERVQAPDVLEFGDWWTKLRHEDSLPRPAIGSPAISDTEEAAALEGDFQTQPTPPKRSTRTESSKTARKFEMRNSSPISEQHQTASGSTTDESDNHLQSFKLKALSPLARNKTPNAPANDRQNSLTPSKSGLKATSNRDAALRDGQNLPKVAIAPKAHGTNSSSDGDEMDLSRKSPVPLKSVVEHKVFDHFHAASKSKSKLGKIGGTKPIPEDIAREPTLPASKPKSKLGKIGGVGKIGHVGAPQNKDSRPAAAALEQSSLDPKEYAKRVAERLSAPDVAEPGRHSRATLLPKGPSPPNETEEERANKKREQLKRELESKSQAGAKKKRKF